MQVLVYSNKYVYTCCSVRTWFVCVQEVSELMDSHTAATSANLSRLLSELYHCNDGRVLLLYSHTQYT